MFNKKITNKYTPEYVSNAIPLNLPEGMRTRYSVILLTFLTMSAGLAQDTAGMERQGRIEFAMNVSTALRNFAGGTNPQIMIDPYLAAFKFVSRNERHAFRIGLNYNYTSSEETIQGGIRTTEENTQLPIIGYELRDIISRKFEVYYGLDMRGIYMNSNLETKLFIGSGTPDVTTLDITRMGAGAGPFVSFVWHAARRVRIYTEGSFYVNMYNEKRVFTDNNVSTTLQDKNVFTFLPALPSSIFISIRF